VGFVFLVFLAIVVGQEGSHGSGATNSAPNVAKAGNPEHEANLRAIPADMARVYDSLRDQSGVKWGTMTGTRNGTTLCGSVNARNAFGGYAGQRRFIFDQAVGDPGLPPGRDAYLHWEEHKGFAREWNRLCLGDPNSVTLDGQSQAALVEALAPQEQDSGL